MPLTTPGLLRQFTTSNVAGPTTAAQNLFGTENVALGVDAGKNVGTVPTTSVLGGVYIGTRAGRDTQFNETIIIGRDAAPLMIGGLATQAGSIAIGARALNLLGSGTATNQEKNLAIGFEAMVLSNGSAMANNVVIGYRALAGNLTADNPARNVVIGSEAGERINQNTLANAVIIGYRAGRTAGNVGDTANNCVLIGREAGASSTVNTQNNVYIGAQAGTAQTTGNSNVVIGTSANITGGSWDSCTQLGAFATNASVDAVTAVGQGIGATSIGVTIIGRVAGGGLAAGSHGGAIVIGQQAASAGVPAGGQPFIAEARSLASTGNPTPFLFGDMTKACLMIGQHVAATVPTHRGFPTAAAAAPAGPMIAFQDAAAAGGGVAQPTVGATGVAAIFFDSATGANGALRAIGPNGVVVTLAAF